MSRWDDSGTWVGEALRREVFFFSAGDLELYGSIYAPASPEPHSGVVICNSWGFEGNLGSRIVHALSLALAREGLVALNFHYPGFGDSQGDFASSSIEDMAAAAVAAAGEGVRRYPAIGWASAGLMLGASIAALSIARGAPACRLLLVQPALRPGAYFDRLERSASRHLGGPAPPPAPGFAHGYPLAPQLLEAAPAADADVEAALADFDGEGAVVRYEKPTATGGVPERFEQICVPGVWRFGSRHNPALVGPAAQWLWDVVPVESR